MDTNEHEFMGRSPLYLDSKALYPLVNALENLMEAIFQQFSFVFIRAHSWLN